MKSTLAAHLEPLLLLLVFMVTVDVIGRVICLRRVVPLRVFFGNVASWGIETLARNLVFPVRYALFAVVAASVPWEAPTTVAAWCVAYVLVDLLYYWKHRWLHHNGLLWSLHMPHHSIRALTADGALRLGWFQRLFDDFFYLPLALLGFPAWTILMAVEVNHLYQWWCHAEWIGQIRWLDGWLNTPSNHRVHHSSKQSQVRSNFGSTFMVWDRLFGTYQPEPAEGVSVFGVDIGYVGENPFRFQLTPVARYLRSRLPWVA